MSGTSTAAPSGAHAPPDPSPVRSLDASLISPLRPGPKHSASSIKRKVGSGNVGRAAAEAALLAPAADVPCCNVLALAALAAAAKGQVARYTSPAASASAAELTQRSPPPTLKAGSSVATARMRSRPPVGAIVRSAAGATAAASTCTRRQPGRLAPSGSSGGRPSSQVASQGSARAAKPRQARWQRRRQVRHFKCVTPDAAGAAAGKADFAALLVAPSAGGHAS
jgi:hypothetical protein